MSQEKETQTLEGYITLLKNTEGEISYPYTVAEAILTKDFESDLAQDLETIQDCFHQLEQGGIKVKDSVTADRLSRPQRFNLTGGLVGTFDVDGVADKEVPVVIQDDSHEHHMETIVNLQETLDHKLGIEHDHEHWNTFGSFKVNEEVILAQTPADTFTIKSGNNLEIVPLPDETGVQIQAILTDTVAMDSRKLDGMKPAPKADRVANDMYIPVAQYGESMDVGQALDFHLPGSQKDYDLRLGIESDLNLFCQLEDQRKFELLHRGQMGHGTGIDADLLDGKQGSDYSLIDHIHSDYEETLKHLKQTKGLALAYQTTETILPLDKQTLEELYETTFDLLTEHESVEKRILGKDTSNQYDIVTYDFKPQAYDRTLLLVAGLDGKLTSFYALYHFLKDLCIRHKEDAALSELKERTRFVVLPMANPWGWVNQRSQNVNDVYLNHNFSEGWESLIGSSYEINGTYYKGASPFSERETILIQELVEELKAENLTGFVHLHEEVSLTAKHYLMYPTPSIAPKKEYARLSTTFETPLIASSVCSALHWMSEQVQILAVQLGGDVSNYDLSYHDQTMTNLIGNTCLTLIRTPLNVLSGERQIKVLTWKKDTSSAGETILNSQNYNTVRFSQSDYFVESEGYLKLDGHVQIQVTRSCTLWVEPLLYQPGVKGQTFEELSELHSFEEEISLTPGTHYLPLKAVLPVYPSVQPEQVVTGHEAPGTVQFRLRTKSNVTDAAYLTRYQLHLDYQTTNRPESVLVEEAGQKAKVFPRFYLMNK